MKVKNTSWPLRAPGTVAVLLLCAVLASQLWVVSAESQSAGEVRLGGGLLPNATELPPSWVPPVVSKETPQTEVGYGDAVVFTILVTNPSDGVNQVAWTDVALSDAVPPELRIDKVTVNPPGTTPVIIDNVVKVTVPSLAVGQWFSVQIECTVVGPAQGGEQIVNEALVMYTDPDGDVHGPAADSATIEVMSRLYLPLIIDAYSPAPQAPVLYPISNPDGLNVYLVDWSTVPEATAYRLQEAHQSNFADGVVVYGDSLSQYTAYGRQPTRYYYRVLAQTNEGDTGWSNPQSTDVLWELEPNDDGLTQANGPILSGLTYRGTMPSTSDQKDYFFFELAASGAVQIWLTNIAPGENLDLVLRDEDLGWIKQSASSGNTSEYLYQDGLAPGVYKIQIYHTSGAGSSQPYNLRAVFD